MLKDFFKNMFADDDDFDDEEFEDEDYDEIDEEEDEEKEVEETPVSTPAPASEYVAPALNNYRQSDAASQPLFTQPKAMPDTLANMHTEPEEKKTSFTGLSIEEVDGTAAPKRSQKPKTSNTPYHFDRSKLTGAKTSSAPKPRTDRSEYQAVISPIFGNVHDEEKEFDKVHDAINLPHDTVSSSLTGVISPIFGTRIPNNETPVEEIPEYEVHHSSKPMTRRNRHSNGTLNSLVNDDKEENK